MNKKMPDNAKFPVPPGPHAAWNDQDWYDWWQKSGGRLDPNPHYENPDPMPPMSYRDWDYFIKDMEESSKKALDK